MVPKKNGNKEECFVSKKEMLKGKVAGIEAKMEATKGSNAQKSFWEVIDYHNFKKTIFHC